MKLVKAMLSGCLLVLMLPLLALASMNIYEFEDEEKRQQFDELIQELRCPKCQNQNIADSDAGVAKLIKDRVYKLVQDGKNKAEVTDHMIDRYGEFVTYRPRLKQSTFLLWFGPVLGLLIALIALMLFVRRNKRKPAALSEQEQQKLQALVKKYGTDDDQTKQ